MFHNQPVFLEKPFTFDANGAVQLRIYPDNRPRNMEIAALQKGLVLMLNGSELIEEGAGFGVPIVKYYGATYFSRTATVYVDEQNENEAIFTKVFVLDSVSRKRIYGAPINENFYSVLQKTFEKAYLHSGSIRSLFDSIMIVRRKIGIETYFSIVSPRGKVTVNYHCFPDHIRIRADFSEVEKTNCQEILILNEQGATFFRRSVNGNNVSQDGKIGAWKKVNAGQVKFAYAEKGISFSMEKRDDATLYCGWERIEEELSWSGMTYALSPKALVFSYDIRLQQKET